MSLNPSQIFCKIIILKNLSKSTRKHLCRIFVLDKVESRKISQNSEKFVCVGVSFLIELQVEKICKIYKRTPVPKSQRRF